MALVACKECGKKISKKAEVCPNCGFKPKRTSLFTKIVAIVIGVPFVLGIIGAVIGSNTESSVASAPAKTPEQLAAETKARAERKAAEAKEQAQMKYAMLGGATLKKSMRNPDSFKVDSAIAMEATGAVCYTYRAQNGFGGINVESAVLTSTGDFKTESMDGFHNLWNKNCAKQRGIDYARYIR